MYWIIAAFIIVALLMLLLAHICLQIAFGARCEGNPSLKYFTCEDFDDLDASPVEFPNDKGCMLRGAVYTCRASKPKALVIFSHGMGGGHLSYTTNIRTVAKAGYAVLAYDNTGTMASDGKSLRSFYQAVKDVGAALDFARKSPELSQFKIVLAGHSWGAYSVCQIAPSAEEFVSGVVALSPPNSSVGALCDSIKQIIGVSVPWLRPALWAASVIRGGKGSGRKVSSALMKTEKVPVLILQGDSDTSVPLKNSPLSVTAVTAKKNITGIIYEGKAHNVYQTKESEKYLNGVFAEISKAEKRYGKKGIPENEKAKLYDIDYELIVREDPDVMKTVTDFIDKCVSSEN